MESPGPPWTVSDPCNLVDGELVHYRIWVEGFWSDWKRGRLDVLLRRIYPGLSKRLPKFYPDHLLGTISSLDILDEDLPGFCHEDFVDSFRGEGPAFFTCGIALQLKSFLRVNQKLTAKTGIGGGFQSAQVKKPSFLPPLPLLPPTNVGLPELSSNLSQPSLVVDLPHLPPL